MPQVCQCSLMYMNPREMVASSPPLVATVLVRLSALA
jgi:hypothetical protein